MRIEESSEEAAADNAVLMVKVLPYLKEFNIAESQIITSWYKVWPVYKRASPPCIEIHPKRHECASKTEIVGYGVSVTVTFDASDDVGQVIDAAVAAGAINVNGAYFVSNEGQEELRQNLTVEAIAKTRSRADETVEAVNMEITGVDSINLSDVYFPVFKKFVQAVESDHYLPRYSQARRRSQ